MNKTRPHGSPFTMLVGNRSLPSNPSAGEPGVIQFDTYTAQTLNRCGAGSFNSQIPATKPTLTVDITVADNDFSDAAILILGDVRVVSGLDFVPAGTTALTAVEIGSAIDGRDGMSATVNSSTVTVTLPYTLDKVPFRAEYLAAITNYTLSPATGYFAYSAASLNPPTL